MAIIIPRATQQLRPAATNTPVIAQADVGDRGAGAAAIAQGLGQAGQTASAVGDAYLQQQIKLQEKRNQERVFRATTIMQDQLREFETQVRNSRRGATAFGLQSDAQDWWGKTSDKVAQDSLDDGNDAQRALFAREAARMRDMSLDGLASYESQELDKAFVESVNGMINSMTSFAAQNSHSESALGYARENVVAAVNAESERFGRPPDSFQHQFQMTQALTGLHRQVFENILEEDTDRARDYFERFKTEIDGQTWEYYTDALKVADDLGQAQAWFDGSMTEDMTFAERHAALRDAGLTPEARRIATGLLDAEENRIQERTKRAQEEADNLAYANFIESGRNISRMNRSLLSGATPEMQRTLEDLQKTPSERIVTNEPTWNMLRRMSIDDRVAFSTYPIERHFNNLDQDDQRRMQDLQAQIKQALEDGDEATIASVLTPLQMFDAAYVQLGIDDDEFSEQQGLFREELNRIVMARSKNEGVDLTKDLDKLQELIDQKVREVRYDPPGWYRGVRESHVFQIEADPELLEEVSTNIRVTDVPPRIREQIEEALRLNGYDVSDEGVLNQYMLYLGGADVPE